MLQGLLNFTRRDLRDYVDIDDNISDDERNFLDKNHEQLELLEGVRKEKYWSYKFRKSIAFPAFAILALLAGTIDLLNLYGWSSGDGNYIQIVVAVGLFLYGWVTYPCIQYVKRYKKDVLPDIVKLFGDFHYMIDGKVDATAMEPSKILPKYDKYEAEDYFDGTYKGVNVEFSEVDFLERRRSKNRTYYVSVFDGLAILLDMNSKKFYGHTILDKDKGKVAEWFKEKSSDLKRANLVDPEFEGIFDVYTNDQMEARYLIDPVMMERLKSLQEEYGGDSISAAFYDSKMLVLIKSGHNFFEPADINVPATDPRSILRMKKDIGEILSLIDRLSLYDPQKAHEITDST